MRKFDEIVGKTIVSAKIKKHPDYDDEGWLELKFSDGTKVLIEALSGFHSGQSMTEYPYFIRIDDHDYSDTPLVDVDDPQVYSDKFEF